MLMLCPKPTQSPPHSCCLHHLQFVDFTKIMSAQMSRAEKEERFALEVLEKIPSQYAAIISQRIRYWPASQRGILWH